MKRALHIPIVFCLFLFLTNAKVFAQSNNPAPYCNGTYNNVPCNNSGPSNSPGNFINDFIDNFITSGANTNINHPNSGCNNAPNNYGNYCQHYLSVSPGQTISCQINSGITFAQGFVIYIDWNQDNVFQNPAEQVAATSNVPAAATWTTLTFVVPPLQANGTYRMRVRCAWATPGTGITPCGNHGYGETQDYSIFIGPIPAVSGVVSATLSGNSPLCTGQTLSLNAVSNFSAGITYTWTGPNSYSSTSQNPVLPNVSSSASGVYTMITSGGCPASKTYTVNVIPYPTFSLTPTNPVICQGGSITAAVVFSLGTNTALYSYTWGPNPGFGLFNTNNISTLIIPPLIATTQSVIIYTVTVSRTALSCPVSQTLALTINNPTTPTLTMPPPLCNTAAPFILSATPGGGTWSANPAVSPPGTFSPGVATIGTSSLVYAVSVGNCVVSNSANISVSQFITPALSSNPGNLCVQDPGFNLMAIVQNTTNGVWSGPAVSNNVFFPNGLPTGFYPLTYSTQSTPITSVCPASTVLSIYVFNPPTPVISAIAPKCNTSSTLALSASPNGGVWTGSGISPTGIQNPALNLIGTNTLTYTAGQGTCVASSTSTFFIAQFNTAAFSATVPNLCVNNNPFNLMSIVQNSVNGSWSGVNVNPLTSLFNPAGLPSNTYALTYNNVSSPNINLCNETRTIAVSVLNPVTPAITQVGPFCNNSPNVQLTVSPNTGSWTPANYLNTNGVLTPSLCGPGNNLVQYVIGTNTCNNQSNIFISIEAFVPATIVNSIPDQCNTNSSVNLLPLTANNFGVWSGAGVSGANFSPQTTGAGVYVLSYSTSSSPSGLCPDQSTLAVTVYSLASPSLKPEGPFCNSAAPIQLQASPTGGLFGGPVTGAVSVQGVFLPYIANIGDNVISYSISSGPCIAYAQSTITVERFVSADFTGLAGPFCRNGNGVNMNSFVVNQGGMWTGSGMQGSMFYPAIANVGNNNILIYRTSSFPTATLCPDQSTMQVQVNPMPMVSVTTNTNQGCVPLQVILNTPNTNTGEGLWNLGDGSVKKQGLSVSHVYDHPGTYTVMFNYHDEIGCEAQAELPTEIRVYEIPKADFSAPLEVLISSPEVQFTNLSTVLGNNTYNWTIENLYQGHEINPVITFKKIGRFPVTLQATTIHGCKHEVTRIIEVKNDFNVYIPSSFTPNFDGLNDVFMPVFSEYGLDPKTYELEIFDRWGHSLFYTKDVTKGWDGSVNNKGNDNLKEDTFIYKIKYKDLDGNVYNKLGHITLLK